MRLTEFALYVVAAARLTQLVGRDAVVGPLRARWIRRAYRRVHGADEVASWDDMGHWSAWDRIVAADGEEAPAAAYLIRCVWCLGFHVSWLWLVGWAVWPEGWWWASLVLAASWLVVAAHNVIAAVAAVADR